VVNDIYQAADGLLWLATSGGLYRFEPRAKQFTRYLPEPRPNMPAAPASRTNIDMKGLAPDRSGLLWIGTVVEGLYLFDPRAELLVFGAPPLQPSAQMQAGFGGVPAVVEPPRGYGRDCGCESREHILAEGGIDPLKRL